MNDAFPLLLPGQDQERTDSLPTSGAFSVSPFAEPAQEKRLPQAEAGPVAALDDALLKRLGRLRQSPGFTLLAGSVLFLQTVQLDMDTPLAWPTYARRHLVRWLTDKVGKPLNPDRLHVQLHSPHTWVDEQDDEHDSLAMTLTELAVAAADPRQLTALGRALSHPLTRKDGTPAADLESLSTQTLARHLIEQPWPDAYQQDLELFWKRHGDTWRHLARLSFLDELERQLKRKTISRDGHYLSLDALGYRLFPGDYQAFSSTGTGQAAEVHLLYINEEAVPGLFQVRSKITSHCFIHRPGTGRPAIEYISDNRAYMSRRLLNALNDSPMHRQWLYAQELAPLALARVEARVLTGDVFAALQQASQTATEAFWLAGSASFAQALIRRGLILASAVELWQQRPSIFDRLPIPQKVAGELMKRWLHEQHGLDLDPRQVFVAWRPGSSTRPLGHVRHASSQIRVPATRAVNLVNALLGHYQAQQPQGYIDEQGRSVVWHDPTGKGQWQADKVLPVSAGQLADYIGQAGFLAVMSRHIEDFWQGQQPAIEQALRNTLVTQAVICLKQGQLQRSGFDIVVKALSQPDSRWSVPGFQVQSSFIEGLEHQPCASLLLLSTASGPQCVLYQAGLHKAFIQFADRAAFNAYLHTAMADDTWRSAVMQYIPERHRQRLDYLFRLWAGEASFRPPASILRPWIDFLYQPDRHLSPDRSLYEQTLPAGQPFGFICQTLRDNALEHARQSIVTSGQQTLRYWSEQLRHLQWLMAPLSIWLTPATLASLATELGIVALDIAKANLPGPRYREKQQALLSVLTFGLWSLLPATPRLPGAMRKLAQKRLPGRHTPGGSLSRGSGVSVPGPTSPRQTRLEPFFHTGRLLKRWTCAGPQYGNLPVHAWKLGRKLLLWTSDRGQARTLVVSTHGYYLPWSKTVKVPNGTEIRTYAPHGHVLIDPGLHRVVSQRVGPFALSTTTGHVPALPALSVTDKVLAGTSLPGRLKNYTIAKYQSLGTESYADISRTVRNSNSGLFSGQLPATPMDVLTVRNRFGSAAPTLDELFTSLASHGIHYDRILLVHCRCAALSGLFNRAPVYNVPLHLPNRPVTP